MELMAGVCLFMQSIWDIRTKKIPLWISLGLGGCSFFYSLCCQRECLCFLLALLPGVCCLILSFCTRESIGYGDGILLCSLAMLYSLEEMTVLILIAVFLAGIIGVVLLTVFHKNGKYGLPFVPFLFLGWLLSHGLTMAEGVFG